ncbi:MAG: glycosyltransferase family 87 protein [Actinomycetes bacterium]
MRRTATYRLVALTADSLARRVLPFVPVVAAVMLVGGLAFKAPCLSMWHGQQFSSGCYNDLQFLYDQRGIPQHIFPYVHGKLLNDSSGDSLVGGAFEYPVLTGVFAWFAGLFTQGPNDYLIVSAVLLAPFGLLAGWLLVRMTGWRALYLVAAPAVVLYAYHNWDLLVVAATVAAFYAWWRDRFVWAAILLGIGGCLKLYPAFFLAPLLLERLAAGDRRTAVRATLAGVGTVVLLNLPFALINPAGWWAPYDFQRLRNADLTSDSIWIWGVPQLTRAELNALTPILIAVAFTIALGVGWWRARREGVYPFVQVCGAMLLAFCVLGKVFSPQYALWILPFFALVRVRWGWWVAFVVADLVLYFGLFRWYYDFIYRHVDFGLAKQALVVGIWSRAAVVALLYVVFLGARSALLPSNAHSNPPATVP